MSVVYLRDRRPPPRSIRRARRWRLGWRLALLFLALGYFCALVLAGIAFGELALAWLR